MPANGIKHMKMDTHFESKMPFTAIVTYAAIEVPPTKTSAKTCILGKSSSLENQE